MTALSRILSEGFTVSLFGDALSVKPSGKLTMRHRDFLKQHKAEIMGELKQQAEPLYISHGVLVVCYTPLGKPVNVQATSSEHAAFLTRMNPAPKG